MSQQIVTVSSQGQFTLPVAIRKELPYRQFLLGMKGKTLTLKPLRLEVVDDETEDFSALAETSFSFWNSPEDDAYDNFCKSAPAI